MRYPPAFKSGKARSCKRLIPFGILLIYLLIGLCSPCTAQEEPEPATSYDYGISNARRFYDGYGKARKSLVEENYNQAVITYQRILSYADSKAEQMMVYDDMARAYKGLGDLNREMYYLQRATHLTTDNERRQSLTKRAEDLQEYARDIGHKITPEP